MITEIVVLLVALCILCIRNDLVKHTWAFLAAALMWVVSRALMEISFKGDTYEYSWGSLPSLLAVACLFLCVVFMFLACRGHRCAAIQQVAAAKSEKPEDAENAPTDPSSRLRHLAESQSDSDPAIRR